MPPAAALLAEVKALREALSAEQQEKSELLEQVAQMGAEKAHLEQHVAWLKKQLFGGGKSDRFDPAQTVFEGIEGEPRPLPEKPTKDGPAPKPRPRRPRRDETYGDLPILEERVEVPEEVQAHPDRYEQIGEEETFELIIIAPKFGRRRILRPKYRLIGDKTLPPVLAPAPVRVVEGIASHEFLIYMVLSKYLDHLPLARQARQYSRFGANIAPQSMVRWVEKVAAWLKPIYNYIGEELLNGGYIQADETPIRYCDPDYGSKTTRQGYLCGYSRPHGNVYFVWQRSRSREAVTGFLEPFEGVLQCDAYRAYLSFAKDHDKVDLLGCWAHARRKFTDIQNDFPHECERVLSLVRKLYKVETDIKENGLSEGSAIRLRQEQSRPILERLHDEVLNLRKGCLPRSGLGKACDYTLANWKNLTKFLHYGHVQIDNNLMENVIRPSAIGKKNWLFVGHPEAGDRPAIIYSILLSCQRFEISPTEYLSHVFNVDTRCASNEQLAALTPANFKHLSTAS